MHTQIHIKTHAQRHFLQTRTNAHTLVDQRILMYVF